MCIISTAQQARPNVMGQIEPWRAQLTSLSRVESTYSDREVKVGHATKGKWWRDVPALLLGVSRLCWFEPRMAREVMGSVGEVVEVGMGSGAWTEFEVCTKREATGRLSGERTVEGDIPWMPSAGRSAAARDTGWRCGQTRLERARTRTWGSQNSERHGVGWFRSGRMKMEMHVPTVHPPRRGCRRQKGSISP